MPPAPSLEAQFHPPAVGRCPRPSNTNAQSAEVAAPFIAQVSGNLATVDLGLTFFDYPYIGAASAYLYRDTGYLYPDNANQSSSAL
jgi:hypothetical protein